MASGGCKLPRLTQRLQSAIDSKRFYEAHQIYKTIYFRCLTRKSYAEALEFLRAGALFLLNNEQWESGIDLASLILEVYSKSKLSVTEEHLENICELLLKMPPGEDRTNFINKAVGVFGQHKSLQCLFNERLARLFWQEGSFSEARIRIMLSSNGYAVGTFLVALHQRYGLRSEIDLFVTQAVLQFLCMRKASVASLTFYTYTRGHPKLEPGPPFIKFPLLNFLWFLMLAIEQKCNIIVFSVLCERYSPQINRDSTYLSYLDKIGQLYFGVEPPANEMNNLFSNLLRMFSGNDNDLPLSSEIDETEDVNPFESGSRLISNALHIEDVD